jgi:PAS domain S-box-containing protein
MVAAMLIRRWHVLRSWLILAVLMLWTAGSAIGQVDQDLTAEAYAQSWHISKYAEAAGVQNQRVFDLAFEPDGTLWLAASDGLRRFDGFRWERFDTNSGLPSSFIRTVIFTKKGELWVGSDQGAGVFDFRRKHFDHRGSDTGLAGPHVRRIAEDPDGSLWFSCDQWPEYTTNRCGLSRLQEGRWTTYRSTNGLPMDYVIAYFREASGRQYASTRSGWVEKRGEMWIAPQDPGANLDDSFHDMTQGSGDTLFANGANVFMGRIDGQWRVLGQEQTLVCATRKGEVFALPWNSQNGLQAFQRWNGREFARMSCEFARPYMGRLYRIKEAPDGAIWCVGYGTVVRWSYGGSGWGYYPKLPPPLLVDNRGQCWFSGSSNVVCSVAGRLCVIEGMQRLMNVDDLGRAWGLGPGNRIVMKSATSDKAFPVDCSLTRVFWMGTDNDGTEWAVGTESDGGIGVMYWDEQKWQAVRVPDLKDKNLLSESRALNGGIKLLARTRRELPVEMISVTKTGARTVMFPGSMPRLTYPTLLVAANRYWIRGYGGLYYSDAEDGAWQEVQGLSAVGYERAVGNQDELAFLFNDSRPGLGGCGLFHSNKWQQTEGVFLDLSYGHKGSLFISGNGNIYIRRTPGTLDLDTLPLPENTFANRVIQDRDGSLWIGLPNGVLHYHPSQTRPQVEVSCSLTEIPHQTPLPVEARVLGRYSLDSTTDASRFSWRVDGGEWSGFARWPGRFLPLNAVAPGSHILEVLARDSDGLISPVPAEVHFTVLAVPLQQQAWFRPAVVFVFALILTLSLILARRTHQIAGSNEKLRREIDMRRQTESALARARDELEQRVADRTSELSAAIQSLNNQVQVRLQTEQALRQSEERVRMIFDSVSDAIFVHELGTGRIVETNQRACEMYGRTHDDILSGPIEQLSMGTPPYSQKEALEWLARAEAGRPQSFEWRSRDRHGRLFWTDLNARRANVGGQDRILVTARDISARKEAEAAFRAKSEELDRFFTLSLDLLCIADIQGSFRRLNEAWFRTLKFSPEEMLGRPLIDFAHPDDVEKTRAVMTRLEDKQAVVDFVNRCRCKDGSYRWIEWRSHASGQFIYAAARDITERHMAQEYIEKLNVELERRVADRTSQLMTINEELHAFSYSVSHDLRAPLRAINGFASALHEDYLPKLDEAGRDYLERIRAASQRMERLIDDLLKLSRVTRASLTRGPVELSLLAESVFTELRAANPERSITANIQPGMVVNGDAGLLRLVMDNLIGNAWKFTRNRKDACIEVGSRMEDGSRVWFVQDNGTGFDMAFSDKLFGAFQRLHSSQEYEGTGIGLATVQRIIHRHGGRTWAVGHVGEGAKFCFTLGEN